MRKFIFGDLHDDYNGEAIFLTNEKFPEQKELTKEDILFQLGDFGMVWYYPKVRDKYKKEQNKLNDIANRKFTLLVIPGNHENYDLISQLPIIEKWGGKVYEMKLKKNSIYFALRGEVYTIDNKKYFVFGGAKTQKEDNRYTYQDFASQKKVYKKKYKYQEHYKTVFEKVKLSEVNFWEQEETNEEEMENAIKNLDKNNWKVDYVLTHTPPQFLVEKLLEKKANNEEKFNCKTAVFLDTVNKKLDFKEWYYGHLHMNNIFEEKIMKNKYICHYKRKPLEIDI